jgi:hypothetical protein
LAAIPLTDTSAVAHRSTYYELDVVSASPYHAYGGCSSWSSVLGGDVMPSQYSYRPQSLTIATVTDAKSFDRDVDVRESDVTCGEPDTVSRILSALTTTVKPGSAAPAARTFPCGADSWVVRHCPVTATTYAPGLCVGCVDPCSATLRCNTPSGVTEAGAQASLAPCVEQVCPGTSASSPLSPATAVRILTVKYADIEKAPTVLSVTASAAKTSLQVTAQLTSAGALYVAVYREAAAVNAPSSSSAVQLQNLVAVSNAANVTSLTVPGLDAATAYRVYLMTVSPIGVKASLDEVLHGVLTVSTACCKAVTGTLSAASAIEGQATTNLLSIRVSSSTSSVTVQVSLFSVSPTDGALSAAPSSLFPASFTMSAQSAASTLRASLPSLPVGVYEYRLTMTGPSAAEYEVVYANSKQRIEVLSALQEPPAPAMTSAAFANDGSYVTIAFSGNTNKGGTATTFTCSSLFVFDCAATSRCQWMDAATVRAYVQGATASAVCARPTASTLRLTDAAVVKARCEAVIGVCSSYADWKTAPTTAVVIQGPASAVVPSVAISAPSVLGSCDSLALDASGSTGSGGRAWDSVTVTTLSTQGSSVGALSARLAQITALTPPPVLPSALLDKGQTYNFMIKLCNFLGQCGTGSKQVLVLNDTLPSVSLPGPALRMMYRKDALLLASSAFVTECGGGRSSAGLTYRWVVSSNGVQLLSAVSTSKDPSKFLLPTYSLSSGVLYKVSLSVGIAGTSISAEASTQVFVQTGSVVASIRGAGMRSLRVGDKLTLDASRSYDEDQSGVTGAAAWLRLSWSCVQTAPSFNASCASVFEQTALRNSMYTEALQLVPLAAGAGSSAVLTVEVSDASGQRTTRTSVTVAVLHSLSPSVTVSAPNLASSGVLNAGRALQLMGVLGVPQSLGGNATWAVDDASVDLARIALFPLTVSVPAVANGSLAAVASATSYMAFAPNTLPVGATLTFSLIGCIPYQGKRAVASVTVTINAPPTSGSFYVDPSEGRELQQSFQFVALQWVDPDLPLTYQFSYVSSSGVDVVLRSRLELSYGSSLLPAGPAAGNYSVASAVQVYDALSANASATFSVAVLQDTARNASEIGAFVASQMASAASDTDSLKQAMALSSYLLNAVNCTLAPDCAVLHRKSCLSTAHTCGACESDLYVGEEGDSNEQCVSIYGSNRLLSVPEGGRRRLAVEGSDLPKPCAANCSGHGVCYHVTKDSRQVITAAMPPCLVGALDCVAVCDCEPAFYGSDTCEVPAEEFRERQASREAVVAGLQRLVALENPDEQVIGSWVSSLAAAAQVASELTAGSAVAVLSVVDSITSTAKQASGGEVSAASLEGLLKAVSSVAEYSSKVETRRRLLSRRALTSSSGSGDVIGVGTTGDVLNSFGELVALSMLPGQAAANYTQGEFRMSVQVLSSDGGAEVTAAVPQTSLEKLFGSPASQVVVPAAEGVSLVTTSLQAHQYDSLGAELQGNPVSVYASGKVCAAATCPITVVMQNSQPVDFAALNDVPIQFLSRTCKQGEVTTHTVTCDNGEPMALECTGEAGVVKRQCPTTAYSSACSSLNAKAGTVAAGSRSGCRAVSFTDAEVTCECDMYFAGSRRLSTVTGVNFTAPAGYSVSYVGMLQATTESFTSTLLTADDLSAGTLTQGWRALATLGALAGAIVVGLLWSHHADFKMKKVGPAEESVEAQKAPESLSAVKAGALEKRKAGGGRKVRLNTRAKKALVNAELAIVEDSLPRALSSRTFSDRFLEEVKQHHRWFGIVFYYSDSFPRVLRVMSLATNAIVMLFIQSITYNLTNPDDGSCALLKSEAQCLQPQSPFATGESMCAWVTDSAAPSSSSQGSCVYIQPDGSVRIILFVAIFCAIVTTPIALAADWVMQHILSAPTLQEPTAADTSLATVPPGSLLQQEGDAHAVLPAEDKVHALVPAELTTSTRGELRRSSSSSAKQLRSYLGLFSDEARARQDKLTLAQCRAELVMLAMKLGRYRDTLRSDEVEEFNCKYH